jgi:hypothetical protein
MFVWTFGAVFRSRLHQPPGQRAEKAHQAASARKFAQIGAIFAADGVLEHGRMGERLNRASEAQNPGAALRRAALGELPAGAFRP